MNEIIIFNCYRIQGLPWNRHGTGRVGSRVVPRGDRVGSGSKILEPVLYRVGSRFHPQNLPTLPMITPSCGAIFFSKTVGWRRSADFLPRCSITPVGWRRGANSSYFSWFFSPLFLLLRILGRLDHGPLSLSWVEILHFDLFKLNTSFLLQVSKISPT